MLVAEHGRHHENCATCHQDRRRNRAFFLRLGVKGLDIGTVVSSVAGDIRMLIDQRRIQVRRKVIVFAHMVALCEMRIAVIIRKLSDMEMTTIG
ncbi:hypothetical protein WK47_24770 [Burkholderia ubonensis]|nr:hypothetical protein WK47_24770 [Burkholderia ubonensis]KVT07474.1 hypothetical protein WK46_11125 [Burkholderia ubonensis]KVT33748.1 hypothetical protein WK50_02155 [Burkholderia ubonensis]